MFVRVIGFFILWMTVSHHTVADLVVGAIAACCAAVASVRLLPSSDWQPYPLSFVRRVPEFLWQTGLAAGAVAKFALHPGALVHPHFVTYRHLTPPGPKRDAFNLMTSLLPGSVPCGLDATGALVLHGLRADSAFATRLAADETRFLRMFHEHLNG